MGLRRFEMTEHGNIALESLSCFAASHLRIISSVEQTVRSLFGAFLCVDRIFSSKRFFCRISDYTGGRTSRDCWGKKCVQEGRRDNRLPTRKGFNYELLKRRRYKWKSQTSGEQRPSIDEGRFMASFLPDWKVYLDWECLKSWLRMLKKLVKK